MAYMGRLARLWFLESLTVNFSCLNAPAPLAPLSFPPSPSNDVRPLRRGFTLAVTGPFGHMRAGNTVNPVPLLGIQDSTRPYSVSQQLRFSIRIQGSRLQPKIQQTNSLIQCSTTCSQRILNSTPLAPAARRISRINPLHVWRSAALPQRNVCYGV
ncbi:hypothetical protein CLIM01_04855 [Colletotrichum limetticola]|uniref:Secreted protein n=1 Tax=Colletotrichum limetticola TaxID=1209924 RepID=A0ABQ9Q2A5_9PEZI|nr:hypothetical protein CLIM01_04855 [Colletotrichum limetticola]